MAKVAAINDVINTFVWVKIGIILLLGAGLVMTVCTGFFQVSFIGHWFKQTLGSLLKKDSEATKKTDKKSISAFQSLCTALAATVGTGNIAGVSAAIVIGGPGAVLWMWVAAFLGMMTCTRLLSNLGSSSAINIRISAPPFVVYYKYYSIFCGTFQVYIVNCNTPR